MLIGIAKTESEMSGTREDEAATAFAARHDPESFVLLYRRYLDAIYRNFRGHAA